MKKLLPSLVIAVGLAAGASGLAAEKAALGKVGSKLPDWSEGCLDIHFINTGRGETAFLILPDSTTLLVDAGCAPIEPNWSVPTKPDDSRSPGEWMARYIQRVTKPLRAQQIDTAVMSHFHGDHMGAIEKDSPVSARGGYKLGGVTEIAEHVPIRQLLDRNWPDYNWPVPLNDLKMKNYREFIAYQSAKNGMKVERFAPGRNDQITLAHNKARYPNFEVRNLAANGCVWTGHGHEARETFPKDVIPSENKCSIAFRVSYGKFDYYTGGDLDVVDVEFGLPGEEWKNIEKAVAEVTGPVEVMKANHHANFDANGVDLLRNLQPQVVVACTWGQSQPSMNVYRRLQSKKTYPGPRELFFTNMMASTMSALHINKIKNPTGHIVVRVQPGGDEFHVYVLDDTNENHTVKAVVGPFQSK